MSTSSSLPKNVVIINYVDNIFISRLLKNKNLSTFSKKRLEHFFLHFYQKCNDHQLNGVIILQVY